MGGPTAVVGGGVRQVPLPPVSTEKYRCSPYTPVCVAQMSCTCLHGRLAVSLHLRVVAALGALVLGTLGISNEEVNHDIQQELSH
jgi:hypothetical protein